MARFDVYRFNDDVPLVVEVQADMLSHLASVVVIPLVSEAVTDAPLARLNPVLRIDNKDYTLMTTDMGAVPRALLGPRLANIEAHRTSIVDAVDFLLQGF